MTKKDFGFYNLPARKDTARAKTVFLIRRLLRRLLRQTFYAMEARLQASYLRIKSLADRQARHEAALINVQAFGRRLDSIGRHLADGSTSKNKIKPAARPGHG